jgi:hypothetical protein
MNFVRRFAAALGVAAAIAGNSTASYGQTFASLVGDANHAELTGQYREAAKLYEKAYAVSGFDPVALALAAVSAGHGGDDSTAAAYLRRATAEGFVDPRFLNILHGDSALKKLDDKPTWHDAVVAAEKRYDSIDKPLRIELLNLSARDQANRESVDSVFAVSGARSAQSDSAFNAMATADAPLIARLSEIVKTSGWPDRTLVGDDGAHAAWLVLQHAPQATQAEMLPLVRAAVAKHEARSSDLALLEDRVLADQGKPQLYGSQLEYPDAGGLPTPKPIDNAACVDVRRAAVGLEPISDYLRRFGVDYAAPPVSSTVRCARPPSGR